MVLLYGYGNWMWIKIIEEKYVTTNMISYSYKFVKSICLAMRKILLMSMPPVTYSIACWVMYFVIPLYYLYSMFCCSVMYFVIPLHYLNLCSVFFMLFVCSTCLSLCCFMCILCLFLYIDCNNLKLVYNNHNSFVSTTTGKEKMNQFMLFNILLWLVILLYILHMAWVQTANIVL